MLSSISGVIPTIKGTGAARYSFRVDGRIGIRTCYHLSGNTKLRNASITYPSIVLD